MASIALNRRGTAACWRAAGAVIALTLLLTLSGCSGGGGSKTSLLAGASGSVCLTDAYSYHVEVSGAAPVDIQLDADPLAEGYQGSMGGQIRGITSMNMASADEEPLAMLLWGNGAAVKYGSADGSLGTVVLRKPGAVTDLAPITVNGTQMVVYGTERGLGLIAVDSSGKPSDLAGSGAWRSVPTGVLSVAATSDGSTILFASGDGYLQQISAADLQAGEKCAGIVAAGIPPSTGTQPFVTTKAVLGSEHAFLLAKLPSALTTTAPTFEQAYDPIFSAMAGDAALTSVASLKLGDGQLANAGFATSDESFKSFDRFIPTDIATDGSALYVVGLAYAQQSVNDYLSQNCTAEQAGNAVLCLREGARSGTLAAYDGGTGVYKFVAGFFVYRNLDDLSKADHFAKIVLTGFEHVESAPPFGYVIAASSGSSVAVRGPSFYATLSRGAEGSGAETWTYDAVAGTAAGLMPGLPNRIAPYAGGTVASFTAVRAADGSGSSAVEIMAADKTFKVVDTGAIYVRVEGASSTTARIAAIEMATGRGGKLYIENAVERTPIAVAFTGSFVTRASYDGAKLAYAWSSTGNTANPETIQVWRLAVRAASDAATYGEKPISRAGEATGEFSGFPAIASSEKSPGTVRGIGGIALSPNSTITVLYTGYQNNQWYHQVAIYPVTKPDETYDIGAPIGVMNTLVSSGGGTANAGSLLQVTSSGAGLYEVIFSAPAGIYSWQLDSGNTHPAAQQIFGTTNLVDAAIDAKGGTKIAIVDGFKIIVKDLANRTAPGTVVAVTAKEGTSLTKLANARVALSDKAIALASPYGAAATFSVYNLSSGTPVLAAATPLSRFFDVKTFKAFPQYLLASSQASGIEIYSLSGQ